ncbi:MAG: cytochrome c3 family protein [Acidobacteriota bacterium]|nr:cytochrome c3 family protein [Acidobacteriota bacterium]
MAQIFRPTANSLARTSIILAILAIGTLGVLTFEFVADSRYATRQGDAREQPVPFSHAHHVGSMGIDCRYCHTGVDNSPHALVPPTKTCMNCHSQIWINSPTLEPVRESYRTNTSIRWTKVHDLPDFVYFNHSIHVDKGVGCETCHGRVDTMPLMYQQSNLQMRWCLDCHRNPEKYVRPREFVTKMGYEPAEDQAVLGARLVKEYHIQKLETCWTCHR